MRPADLLILLGLLRPDLPEDWSVRSLAGELHLPQAAVQRSLGRLGETPAYDPRRKRVSRSAAEELFAHAVPFIAPARLGAPTRGVPTAWAAAPLSAQLSESGELPRCGPRRAARSAGSPWSRCTMPSQSSRAMTPGLYEALALVDGVRIGDARVRGLAQELLQARLREGAR